MTASSYALCVPPRHTGGSSALDAVAATAMDAASGRDLLRWMASFDMEGLLLRQLLALKPRVWERACCGMFSGGRGVGEGCVRGGR